MHYFNYFMMFPNVFAKAGNVIQERSLSGAMGTAFSGRTTSTLREGIYNGLYRYSIGVLTLCMTKIILTVARRNNSIFMYIYACPII